MARVIKFLNSKSDEISKLIFHNGICVICFICAICGSDYITRERKRNVAFGIANELL